MVTDKEPFPQTEKIEAPPTTEKEAIGLALILENTRTRLGGLEDTDFNNMDNPVVWYDKMRFSIYGSYIQFHKIVGEYLLQTKSYSSYVPRELHSSALWDIDQAYITILEALRLKGEPPFEINQDYIENVLAEIEPERKKIIDYSRTYESILENKEWEE